MDYSRVLYYFREICKIPHGSGNTKAISDYCADCARTMGLEFVQDEKNNLVIKKPASSGKENHGAVMLQGHLDMVCEKEPDCSIDMEKEPLKIKEEGDFIFAEGTTLGGDDGIAVAMILAILEDKKMEHPPLEAVLTVDEETGMLGASALDYSNLKSKTVINLDSEEEGVFLCGCAGGIRAKCRFPISRKPVYGVKCTLSVDGLRGGHSGVEIHKQRANACVLLGRFLSSLFNEVSFKLISLNGGSKDNAIPTHAEAEVIVDGSEIRRLLEYVEKYDKIYKNEFSLTDAGVSVSAQLHSSEAVMAMGYSCARRALLMLELLPNGVVDMNPSIPTMVETSLNLGVMETDFFGYTLSYSIRSSVESKKVNLYSKMMSLMDYIGGTVELDGDYPGWEFKRESPLRELVCAEYERLTGKKANVGAIHAGLECGIINSALGGADIVSMGPNIFDIHTPNERLSVSSVERVCILTENVLAKL